MPKKRKSETVHCRHFNWRLSQRNGIWHADGRSNPANAGRHSLDTTELAEAKKNLYNLDDSVARKLGLIERTAPIAEVGITIVEGIKSFRDHKSRPQAVGGVHPNTLKRYNRILKKFEKFCGDKRMRYLSEIASTTLDSYVELLTANSNTHASIVTEIVLIKSMHRHSINKKLLDTKFAFEYAVRRPTESTTYCPSQQEIDLILQFALQDESLRWLYRTVTVLAHTGVRFGEASALEFRDISPDYRFLDVVDESFMKPVSGGKVRTTKTRRSRRIPLHKDLATMFKSMASASNTSLLVGPRGGRLRSDLFGDTLRDKILPKVVKVTGRNDVLRLTAHGFRHYFVSKSANKGVPQVSVMNWLGHRTQRMTNYYYHSSDAASLEHMRLLEAADERAQRGPAES